METKKRKDETLTEDDPVMSWPPRRRRRRRRRLRTPSRKDPPAPSTLPAPPATRDWAALPDDALLAIFSRLRHVDILLGVELTCASWRRIAVGKPALWRHIDINDDGGAKTRRADVENLPRGVWMAMARAAVGRGGGQCESYRGPAGPDFLARYMACPCDARSSPLLRSLHLTSFFHLPGKEYTDRMTVIPSFPILERVVLSHDARRLYMYEPTTMASELRVRLAKMVDDLKLPQKSMIRS
nr:putative F-box/LRR-repeat protein 23 [Setaria viridis]